ncbi:MOSC domain-containing protein [Meiothermus sp. QL-1]|uniref:MOSC domain-containing protein n=1 Tax=Meiothermus sp. QL-1 TaxID=2058095 RepID=UPI000E09ED81|nr:MOSC domain-containing protein [Meiothermus sp. QL-1]RDI96127.1 MOSC domain-containing protein [Meiothermus sp. QL-1]
MRLCSIQLAHTKGLPTSIHKTPVAEARATFWGLEGDYIADSEHHGGPDQAVYVYSQADYDYWAEELGEALAPGSFGENLVFSSFGPPPLRIGDRFRIGEVVLEVSAPRIPCATLAARMGDPGFVRRFRQARRPGFYARVLAEGWLRPGQPIEKIPAPAHWPTVEGLFQLWYDPAPSPEQLRAAMAAPLAARFRAAMARRLVEGL